MTIGEVKKLCDRINRIHEKIKQKGGGGAEWKAEVPGFGDQNYKITGVKSPKELEDDIAALAVWVWSMKDYLKKLAPSVGMQPQEVERFIDTDPHLPICADLANKDKHGELDRSRSGRFLGMGRLQYTIPQQALRAVTFRGNEVQIDVATADEVQIVVPVLDPRGAEVAEGLACLEKGIKAWDRLLHQFGVV
jgi:hypothetical protein